MPEWTIFEDMGFEGVGNRDVSEPPEDQVLSALVDICGPDYARVARSIDTVGGRRAGFVAVPATAQAVADVLSLAAGRGLSVLPRGSGSKINWGTPREHVDVLIDTGRLSGLWSHHVEGATVEVATGTPVRALQAALALQGQRLPVDPPSRTATVGGMLAVNESGPLRYRHGTPAEYVTSVAYVDRAGEAADSDGEDGRPGLAEINGVITAASLRLEPLPAARRWAGVAVPTPLKLGQLVGVAAELEPSAIEVNLPAGGQGGALAVLFEGSEAAVVDQAERLAAEWGAGAVVTPIAPPWWGAYPFRRDDVALQLSVSAADLPATLYALGDAAGFAVPVRGSAGLGRVHAVLPGRSAPAQITTIVESVRHVLLARSGRAAIVSAPPELAPELEMAGRLDFF